MSTLVEYVGRIRAHERARRHAASLPLALNGFGLLGLAAAEVAGQTQMWPSAAVPAATYAVLFLLMRFGRRARGTGQGADGYGLVAGLALCAALLPATALAMAFTGAAFFLGLGLFLLGIRGGDPLLWRQGLFVAVASPLVQLVVDNLPGAGRYTTAIALTGLGVVTLLAATVGAARERADRKQIP